MTSATGWGWRPLGELVEVLDARRVPVSAKERASRLGPVPYYGAAGRVGWIDEALFDEPLLLLGEDGVQFFDPYKPKAYLIDGPAWVNNHAHVLRVGAHVERRFLRYYLDSADYRGFANGTTRLKLTQAAMRRLSVPVPSPQEQRRIVDLLEDHLSRLDAAASYRASADRRLSAMMKSVLLEAVPDVADWPTHWRRSTVGEAGKVELGRQRHPDWHTGPNMRPYLRVANVFENRIDTRDLKEMHWPEDAFERFRLQPGDVLLNEGQTPELLGRPAIYRGEPTEVAFTNSLLRFKANKDVLPEFALVVFRRHMHAGRFTRESRITTNIAHLSATRLKPIEFPLPPLDEQQRVAGGVAERLAAVERLRLGLGKVSTREIVLRRALLTAAFSGQLTGRASDLDRAEEMVGT